DNFIAVRNLAGDPRLHVVNKESGIVGRNYLLQRSRYSETPDLQHAYPSRCGNSEPGGESGVSVPLPNELADRDVCAGQRFFLRQKHDAEMLRAGLLSKAGAVHDHDMFLADEFLYKDFVTPG